MLRFEKYQNHLVPIDCVIRVEFHKNGIGFIENGPVTVVYIQGPYGNSTISLKGNQLDKFLKWIRQFNNANSTDNTIWSEWPPYSQIELTKTNSMDSENNVTVNIQNSNDSTIVQK